jgi:hypothetical protein
MLRGFETDDFSSFDCSLSDNTELFVASRKCKSGNHCARAVSIEDDEISTLTLKLDCVSANISFFCKVSSEPRFDHLGFCIDGVEKGKWSGGMDWEEVSFSVTEDSRTSEWTYSKDGSVSQGDDTA